MAEEKKQKQKQSAGAALYKPVKLGGFNLQHGVVLAPLTRMRSDAAGVLKPDIVAEYYAQRASVGGLLIAEATQISPQGQGYPGTPGVHSAAQAAAWQKATQAVRARGATFFCQLWHVGRISHPSFQKDGAAPISSSATAPTGSAAKGFDASFNSVDRVAPRAASEADIKDIIAQYVHAAKTSVTAAGFDGVEVHAANGYLVEQFLHDNVNKRKDKYGGTVENRARFLFEVLDAVIEAVGGHRVGIRISPFSTFGDVHDSNREALFSHVLTELNKRELAYVHAVESRVEGAGDAEHGKFDPRALAKLLAKVGLVSRKSRRWALIAAGGHTKESAEKAVVASDAGGYADAVAFGRHFISNPDLPQRLRDGAELTKYDRSTFYGGDSKGYTDYTAVSGKPVDLSSLARL